MTNNNMLTVWRNGAWKIWAMADGNYAANDPDWLVNIPVSTERSDRWPSYEAINYGLIDLREHWREMPSDNRAVTIANIESIAKDMGLCDRDHYIELSRQLIPLYEYLGQFESVTGGQGTLAERVRAVIIHYATQAGRMHKGTGGWAKKERG
jgi:hypothetical protein